MDELYNEMVSYIRYATTDTIIHSTSRPSQRYNIWLLRVRRIGHQTTVVRIPWIVLGKELLYKGFLVVRRAVHVTKPASRAVVHLVWMASWVIDSGFRLEDRIAGIHFRSAHVRNPGTVVRPCGAEDKVVFAYAAVAVWFGVVAYTCVAGCEEERYALQT